MPKINLNETNNCKAGSEHGILQQTQPQSIAFELGIIGTFIQNEVMFHPHLLVKMLLRFKDPA